ncbi:MAG TPA: cell division protein ZapB [Desulfobulbus sp.]|nr:cell division protein ZapB [Desulfobulbus sp.]
MENNAELAKLEQFVDKLLTKYHELKEDFHALQTTLQERDAECADLKGQVAELSSERVVVGERVSGLIGRIEQWEAEQEGREEENQEEENADNQDQGGVQGSLFEGDSESL